MTLDVIFLIALYSLDDVQFNIICLNVMEDIEQFYLLLWFKTSNCEILVLYFSAKVKSCSICFAFLVLNDKTIA